METTAYQVMHHLSQVAPNSIWRLQAAAEVSESQGNYQAALDQYRQVLASAPGKPGIHYRMGRTLLDSARQSGDQAKVTEALAEFEVELKIDPDNGNAAYEAADIEQSRGDLESAARLFEHAIEVYPGFVDAHIGYAKVLMAQQHPDRAAQELQKAIALDPSNEVSWYRLSQAERALGNSAEQNKAMVEFRKLHEAQKTSAVRGDSSPQEVTRQTLDENEKQ